MDTLFFVISKLGGVLLRVETWVVLALLGISALTWRNRPLMTQWLTCITLLSLLAIGILNPGAALLRPLEARYPVPTVLPQIDGIIVLGGAELSDATQAWATPQVNEAAERFLTGIALARQFPEARLLFTGGRGTVRTMAATSTLSGADVARDLFAAHGIDDERLLLEGRSRNTAENALLSYALAAPRADARWVLVTSAFHMPRAMRSFEAAGWPPLLPYPVDHRSDDTGLLKDWDLPGHMQLLNIALKEYVGLWVYATTGR